MRPRELKTILIIACVGLILRLLFSSPYLEDWDSVQFAQGVVHYSLINHQPHPPGYPIYIFMGKFINFFIQDPAQSLLILSAFFGALVFIPFYFLAKKISGNELPRRRAVGVSVNTESSSRLLLPGASSEVFARKNKIAFLVSLLLIGTPIEWLLSEVALSNIVGMFFTVLVGLILYKAKNNQNYLYLGSFLAGITLGIRFAEYSILLSLLALILIYRKKDLIKSSLFLVTGILVWLIPLISLTGLENFLNLYQTQGQYISAHDSLFSQGTTLRFRINQIYNLFFNGYSPYFFPILAVIVWYFFRNFKKIGNFNFVFASTWLISYLIPLILIYNLEVPRHVLPLLPPLLLLLAISLKSEATILSFLFLPILLELFLTSVSQVNLLHTLTSPTILPVLFVKQRLDPKDTTLITSFTFRQFQYYAPEFTNYHDIKEAPIQINSRFLVLDYQNNFNKLGQLKSYKLVESREFKQPKEIFPRISKTEIFIYERGKPLMFRNKVLCF